MNKSPIVLLILLVLGTTTVTFGQERQTDRKGIEMVFVPGGRFEMGINADDLREVCSEYTSSEDCLGGPELTVLDSYMVTLPGFWMDVYEVTVEHYQNCVNENVCTPMFTNSNWPSDENSHPQQPLVGATWYEAAQFCEWRGARLPTEEEWEYAASGSDNHHFPAGISSIDDIFFANEPYQVGTFAEDVSWAGIYDMAYNVAEWVEDRPAPYGDFPVDEDILRLRADTHRVVRGGSWSNDPFSALTFFRGETSPLTRARSLGFRCARFTSPG
jgi:formylglycine-generating enzyme required for sulfatase activity